MVQRSLSFMLLAGLISCTGDPTGDLHDGVDRLLANPTTFFIESGSSIDVEVTAIDATGNPVEAEFNLAGVEPGITVVRDLEFMPIYNEDGELVPNPRPTTVRYRVTGTAFSTVSGFTVNAGGKSLEVTSVITPPTAGTMDVTTASIGDTITFTAATGARFAADATVEFGELSGIVVSVAADGATMEVQVPGTFTGAPTIHGVEVIGAEGTPVTIPTTNEITTVGGSADPADAIVINAPAVGDSVVLFDGWIGEGVQFYSLNIPAAVDPAGTYFLEFDWEGGADIDIFRCVTTDPTCAAPGYWAGTGNHPETANVALGRTAATTGQIWFALELYSGTAPHWVKITIKRNT